MSSAAARATLVAIAGACLALSVVWLRDNRQLERGSALAGTRNATAAQRELAIRLLKSARTLNADNAPLVIIAAQESLLDRPTEAVATLEKVLRSEPENHVVWTVLADIEATRSPRRSAEARKRARALNPYGSR